MNSTAKTVRIAAWSGPRNISTAMMRSFENRTDAVVSDEPFYACYLCRTGLTHPAYEQILNSYPTDWRDVVSALTGSLPPGKTLWYQKLMAHHMSADMDYSWMDRTDYRHLILLRDPREVLLSLTKILPDVCLEQTGLPQQFALFQQAVRLAESKSTMPVVIDASDVLMSPRRMLQAICNRLRIPFSDRMLNWPAGARDSDGLWGPHWYQQVYRSTTFQTYQPREGNIPKHYQSLLHQCQRIYDQLATHRLRLQ